MLKKSVRTVLILIVTVVSCIIIAMACGKTDGEEKDRDLTSVFAANIEIDFDGCPHSIKVQNTLDGDEIYYSISENGDWYTVNPTFTNVGEYTVYYKVVRYGYADFISFATVTINKHILSDIIANDITYIYDGNAHGIIIKGTEINDIIRYSIDGEEFSHECKQTEVGVYIVYYRVERENGEFRSSVRLTILPNLQGKYLNRDGGIIVLTAHTAIINNEELRFDYDVNGDGTIGAESVGVDNGVLHFRGNEYEKVNEGEHIYMLNINDNTVYVKGEESIEVEITFEQETAILKLNSDVIMQMDGVNYCENAENREYTTSNVTMAFQANSTDAVTECEIILSHRRESEVENIKQFVIYDGEKHTFSFESDISVLYKLDEEYTLESPKYVEVGTYTINIVYIADGYLPIEITATLIIAPCIDGFYYNDNYLIEIDGETVSINGTQGMLEYKDSYWYINGKKVIETETGIKIGDEDAVYKKWTDEKIMALVVDGNYYVITKEVVEIMILYNEETGEVIATDSGAELINCIVGKNGITITVGSKKMDIIRQDGSMYLYLVGISDIDQNFAQGFPIICITSNKS